VDDLMNARQVAQLLGLHENWVYDQAAAGNLPSYKFGGTRRFRRDDIDAWLAAHREGGEHAAATALTSAPPAAPRRRTATQAALFAE
jgi:excisionase family DNA binding protein